MRHGSTAYLFHKYARSPRAQKVYEAVKGKKYQRTSIAAGKLGHKIIAPLEYNGTMHGEFFEVWLRLYNKLCKIKNSQKSGGQFNETDKAGKNVD